MEGEAMSCGRLKYHSKYDKVFMFRGYYAIHSY